MRCTDPRTVGFQADGKTIAWSQKNYSKQYATFQLGCGQCIECRLEYARQWAVRSVHEAKMYEENSFITLTYDDNNLGNPKLDARDYELFVMSLRTHIRGEVRKKIGKVNWALLTEEQKKAAYAEKKIGINAVGEYGEQRKRKHWHLIIFNWRPADCKPKYKNERGDQVYSSEILNKIWKKGTTDVGSVTFHSAGYVARYAAKKLVHGNDGHEYKPIPRKSTHQAIGKKFLEQYWQDVFNHGYIILPDGKQCSIPRYYEKWLKTHHPTEWIRYVTQTKQEKIRRASLQSERDKLAEAETNSERISRGLRTHQRSRNSARAAITKSKFQQLQRNLKL